MDDQVITISCLTDDFLLDQRHYEAADVNYVLEHFRKRIETAFSGIERMLPKSIHAVTARGFETKVFLFLPPSASTD